MSQAFEGRCSEVPVKRAMISPPPPTSLRYPQYNSKGQRYQGLYVPQDFGFGSPPNSPQQKHHRPHQLQGDAKEPSSSSAPRGPYINRTASSASTKALNSSTSASSLQVWHPASAKWKYSCVRLNFNIGTYRQHPKHHISELLYTEMVPHSMSMLVRPQRLVSNTTFWWRRSWESWDILQNIEKL